MALALGLVAEEDVLQRRFGVVINDADQAILDSIPGRLKDAEGELYEHFEFVCTRVLSSNDPELQTPVGIGRAIASVGQYEEQVAKDVFHEVLGLLSSEVGNALMIFKNEIVQGSSSTQLDWPRFAEYRPAEASDRVQKMCENVLDNN